MKYKLLKNRTVIGIIYIEIVSKSLCTLAQQIKHTPTQTKFIAQFVQLT